MIIQLPKNFMINTDKVNYIKAINTEDGTRLTYIRFTDQDSLIIPVSFEEFLKVIKEEYL